jgi:hypothetical protein
MRASKINQLNKALVRITNLATELNNANFNNATEVQIEKIEDREEKACNRAYEICKTMTEEEYNATDFGYVMCMDYEDAIS